MGEPLAIVEGATAVDPELLRAALDASQEAMALAEDGTICYANQPFAELVGLREPSEAIGRPLSAFRPRGYPCACGRPNEENNASAHYLCQFNRRCKDGSSLQIESTCTKFRSGERHFLILTARDVTLRERRRMVRDEDRRFRTIFDGAPMGIVQCDMEGQVLESNPAVERMLGYSRAELRGMHFRDFTHPEDVGRDLQLFEELVAGARESYDLELRYSGKAGKSGWVRLRVSLVRGIDRRPQFAIGMTEDITERKQVEQRLREAEKMELAGRLVGGVAHDFNNLLTGISLYCDLLIAGLEPDSRQRHHAEEIRMAGEQGAALIQQLLAISRKQVVEPRILCLNEIVLTTRNLLSRLLGEKFELATRLEQNLGSVRMDPAQVQQILFNLVLNARDAMVHGGTILVETANTELPRPQDASARHLIPAVMLSVTDRGCGMTPETLSHLFEPFFTTKTNGRGTGLGLATVHNIVKTNGGTIDVKSQPDSGTQIVVRLPRVCESAATDVLARYSPAEIRETILLVEDNMTVRQAAKRILSESGYSVLEAGSGPEAIRVSREHTGIIHVLLADVIMPGMNGRELARQLRAERSDLKVLYMSGYEPESASAISEEESVVPFRKPFTGAALLVKLRETLEVGPRRILKKSGK
jgi:PAS domain S-box-containing protein